MNEINYLAIEPKEFESYTANYLIIPVVIVNLTKSAIIQYALCDSDKVIKKTGSEYMTEEQYANWGEDDAYIINIIAAKEELTLLA